MPHTPRMLRLLSIAATSVSLLACGERNLNFCGDDCPVDASVDARTPACSPGDNKQEPECTAAAPICDTTGSCRPCVADSECDSKFCEAGSCIATENVVYVATDGIVDAMSPPCTIDMKCKSPVYALTKVMGERKYMRLEPGAYGLTSAFDLTGRTMVLHGEGGTMTRGNNQIVDIKGGDITIAGLTIRGGGGANGDAIRCNMNAKVTLRSAVLETNTGYGLNSNTCVVEISRSALFGNQLGGVKISDGRFAISNSFFFGNGNTGAVVGGLFLSPLTTPNTLESNTIVANTADNGPDKAGGVLCDGTIAIAARNNLIHSSMRADREIFGTNCTHTFSVIGTTGAPAGAGNMSLPAADLALKNLAAGATIDDFHINQAAVPASKLKGVGDPATPAGVDFDGDVRPNPAGSPPDIGADEVP